MNSKYLDFYVQLIAGLVVALIAGMLLSSLAEASHGQRTKPVPIHTLGSSWSVGNSSFVVGTLVWEAPRETFERHHRPIELIFQWPKLPSIAEQQIRLAQDKLAVFLAEQAVEHDKKRQQLELQYDWEALKKAAALALILIGLFLSVIYGRPRRVFKSYRE